MHPSIRSRSGFLNHTGYLFKTKTRRPFSNEYTVTCHELYMQSTRGRHCSACSSRLILASSIPFRPYHLVSPCHSSNRLTMTTEELIKLNGKSEDIADVAPNELPCRIRIRSTAEGAKEPLLSLTEAPDVSTETRQRWVEGIMQYLSPVPSAPSIRPIDLILESDGKVTADVDEATQAKLQDPRKEGLVYAIRYRIPPSTISDLPLEERVHRAERFAMGSLFYELGAGEPPYVDEDGEKVQTMFSEGKFPIEAEDLDDGFLVIMTCWSKEFELLVARLTGTSMSFAVLTYYKTSMSRRKIVLTADGIYS